MMNTIRFLPDANALWHALGHFVAQHQALQLVYGLYENGLCGTTEPLMCFQQAGENESIEGSQTQRECQIKIV
jgi:hypothetical protein